MAGSQPQSIQQKTPREKNSRKVTRENTSQERLAPQWVPPLWAESRQISTLLTATQPTQLSTWVRKWQPRLAGKLCMP